MTEISDRYRRLSDQFAARIAAVSGDQWDNPSPCAEWTARDVVKHVVEIRRACSSGWWIASSARCPRWPRTRPVRGTRLVPSSSPTSTTPPGPAPSSTACPAGRRSKQAIDRLIYLDLVVHGWDLARATGQDERIEADRTPSGC